MFTSWVHGRVWGLEAALILGFPKSWGPEIIQGMDDQFSIETYGDFGIPYFKNPPDITAMNSSYLCRKAWGDLPATQGPSSKTRSP